MFHLSDVMKVQAGEKVLGVFRAHPITLVVRLLGFAALMILPCFFLFPLFQAGVAGILIFCAPVLVGILGAWRSVRLWDATALILTDRRLVHVQQRGMWDRHVAEVAFSHVGDVQWEKRGLWRSLWGIGALRIRTNAGAVPSIATEDLRSPDRIAHSIQELRGHGHNASQTHESASKTSPIDAQRERLIHQIQQADAEELNWLEEAMHRPM